MTFTRAVHNELFEGSGEHRRLIRLPLDPNKLRSAQTRRHAANAAIWTEEEHETFLNGLEMYPKGPWRSIAALIESKTERQVMTHAQKYRQKIKRWKRGLQSTVHTRTTSIASEEKQESLTASPSSASWTSDSESVATIVPLAASTNASYPTTEVLPFNAPQTSFVPSTIHHEADWNEFTELWSASSMELPCSTDSMMAMNAPFANANVHGNPTSSTDLFMVDRTSMHMCPDRSVQMSNGNDRGHPWFLEPGASVDHFADFSISDLYEAPSTNQSTSDV